MLKAVEVLVSSGDNQTSHVWEVGEPYHAGTDDDALHEETRRGKIT